ncbi:hypothetical protein AGOR_G00054960 [Albula goreensis]|uniref:Interleukin-1 n=1 Tax=Albula goreensis TaxID=1534307 RepID=A0A8T3DYA9_9TELE|nr:hypothetical protein AGOR_G00054960 [Albula goreensis]
MQLCHQQIAFDTSHQRTKDRSKRGPLLHTKKETDIMEFKAACRDFEKAPRCDLHEGLQLEVTQHPHSLRQVANLIVMLQRMKHNHTPVGTEFSDDDLLNIMLENVLEERVPSHFVSDVESRASVFRSRTTVGCSVCDEQQKSWVLNQWPLQLQAVMLQGSNMDLKVNLSLSTYMARSFTDGASRPVALGIAGKDLYLSCSESDGKPVLQLEEITGKEMLKEIDAQGDMVRFLFLRKDSGFSSTTFESLKFRGWFISTAVENRMPVQMCHKEDDTRITCFTIKQL